MNYSMMMRYTLIMLSFLIMMPSLAMADKTPLANSRDIEIRAAVMDYVKQKTSGLDCEIRIKRFYIGGKPSFPEGQLDYEVVAPQQWEGWGNANISLIARQGERIVQNIPVRIEVEALAEMVVTVRQINHGDIISSSDLALRRLDVAAVQGHYLKSVGDVTGKKARITLKGNSPVKADQLEKVPLIKTGQLVTMIAENDRIRITVTGKAKNAGAEGDTITVQNLSSLKEIPARVIDAGTVMVVF